MPSQDEILAVYAAGPEAMVAWVQELFDRHERQLASVTARVAQLESSLNKDCAVCHTLVAGAFPPHVTQPVQYGPSLKALLVCMQVHQLLSFEH